MFSSQVGNEACNLISEILSDRKKISEGSADPLSVAERIALAQACAIVSVGHEISELTKAAYQISHGVSALAEATDRLSGATNKLTEKKVRVTFPDGKS
jgi:hypothetical protein